MGWLDIVLGMLLALNVWDGYKCGFFEEAASFAGLIVGLFFAILVDGSLTAYLVAHAGMHAPWAGILGFLIPFACVALAFQIGAGFLSQVAKNLSLEWLNHLAGAGFGLLKGIIVLSILLNVYEMLDDDRSFLGTQRIDRSRLYTPLLKAAPALFPSFPAITLRVVPREPADKTLNV